MTRTRIFATTDPRENRRQAKALQASDPTLTVLYDGAGRYAVGHEMGEDLAAFMAPDTWEWWEDDE